VVDDLHVVPVRVDQLASSVGSEPLERLDALYSVVEQAHARAAPAPHWYLRLLGVNRKATG
jgi:hypothetical protein